MTLTNNKAKTLAFTFATSGDFTAVGDDRKTPCNGTLAAKGSSARSASRSHPPSTARSRAR